LVLDAATFLSQAENSYYGALYGFMISRAELEWAAGERANVGTERIADSAKGVDNG
jgi:hypothetical protein